MVLHTFCLLAEQQSPNSTGPEARVLRFRAFCSCVGRFAEVQRTGVAVRLPIQCGANEVRDLARGAPREWLSCGRARAGSHDCEIAAMLTPRAYKEAQEAEKDVPSDGTHYSTGRSTEPLHVRAGTCARPKLALAFARSSPQKSGDVFKISLEHDQETAQNSMKWRSPSATIPMVPDPR